MPVPNREWLRLTPVGATQPAPDYLKAQPPACSSWKASLAVFALFSFVSAVALYSVCKRSRPSRRSDLARPFVSYNLGKVDSGKVEPGSGPVVDAKNQEGSDKESRSEMGAIKSDQVRFADNLTSRKSPKLAIDPAWSKDTDGSHFGFMTRPPPAPPLTPPELSTAVFTFEHRQHTQDSFMHQPNPDYMSSTESPASQASPASPAGARRRSYNKTLPLGIPARQSSSTSEAGSADLGFVSTSYPPTTSLLPPPPPGLQQTEDETRSPGTIDVTGEIISVLDREGAGWTRHTRVYGGGVCLACAASGGHHGGFYGENVSPEEMQ